MKETDGTDKMKSEAIRKRRKTRNCSQLLCRHETKKLHSHLDMLPRRVLKMMKKKKRRFRLIRGVARNNIMKVQKQNFKLQRRDKRESGRGWKRRGAEVTKRVQTRGGGLEVGSSWVLARVIIDKIELRAAEPRASEWAAGRPVGSPPLHSTSRRFSLSKSDTRRRPSGSVRDLTRETPRRVASEPLERGRDSRLAGPFFARARRLYGKAKRNSTYAFPQD